jgi:RNA recognition motif-containing protein
MRRQTSNTSLSSVPRGPPRKPKQSGHALWVGNLPPGATVIDLKDHFSREATQDIESLFLISKSNCAFVNYRTETACQAAMQRFHDSRFHGVRLVCRLRRSSTTASGVPTAPAAMAGRRPSAASSTRSPLLDGAAEGIDATEHAVESTIEDGPPAGVKVAEKFFVVKSLTLQDLEQSVRNGIWATQSHNEQALNKAFDVSMQLILVRSSTNIIQAADNVYLIFSANKSGEYFGYARMASRINENATEIMRAFPQPEVAETPDAPKTIPTPATEWAPRGRIIDDSARGTIFWEAELSDEEEDQDKAPVSAPDLVDGDTGSSQVWGKPFKIEWLSTNRLPFYRTRGLRNPWNANREVKIARDGTELETSVGKRLTQMFHRPGPAPAPQIPMMGAIGQMPQQMGGPSMPY